jgi:hypothetical protein
MELVRRTGAPVLHLSGGRLTRAKTDELSRAS